MSKSIPALWGAAIESWSMYARAAGAPRSTLTTRCQHLGRCARTVGVSDPWQVQGPVLLDWFAAQPWSVETRRGHRSTLRVFYRWGTEVGHLSLSPAAMLPVVRPGTPRPRPTPEPAYRAALAAAGQRERVLLRLAAEVGLRRAEVAGVHSRDLVEDLAGWSLLVHGKGGRERLMPLPDGLASQLRALPPGWAFPGRDGGHLSPRWVGTLVARLLPEGFTMHTLRHRFATRAYAVDRDLVVVQELLGHASPVTTRRYVAVSRDRLRETVQSVA